ncbi:ABC transporter ATP-binding protein [Anaerocolumna sp. MB42-C2]|uniref:ABC transporter ATP-binding protein n=1 Tax=Anaerocolumna sp. MB42-C2 TaxID=3070997 RepID=UPI0027E1ED8E|nr:ABC transporter ATP-binding protein [Anaerocolumna sp. MB42-C2]WMJ85332.1 ABC transporter ATP-binding protein [Anaerocolumna sp. MB42-C2]
MRKNSAINEILKMLYEKKGYIISFFCTSFIILVLNLMEPLLARRFINNIIITVRNKYTILLGLLWILVFSLRTVIEYVKKRTYTIFRGQTIKCIQKEIFKKSILIPSRKAEELGTGYIVSRINDDADSLDGLMCDNLIGLFFAIIQGTWVLLLMVKMNFILALCSIVIAIGYVSVQFFYPLKKLYKNFAEARSVFNNDLYNTLQGLRVIKTHNSETFEQGRFESNISELISFKNKREFADIFRRTASSYLYTLGTPLIYFTGGILILKGQCTVGVIVAFIMLYNLFASSCMTIGTFFPQYNTSVGAAERIQEFLNRDGEKDTVFDPVSNSEGDKNRIGKEETSPIISFDHVSFSYANDSQYSVKDVSFTVYPNKHIAIVGPSGSGKSTIANLLLRLEEPSLGIIYLYGKPITDYEVHTVRSLFGYIQQENYLFSRTVYENIAQGKNLSSEEVKRVLKEAYADSFIAEWQLGINTPISEKGKSMSGGERQRICIAREFAKNAPIILMDEATSSLDPLADAVVLKAIESISKNRTVITITHKLSSIKNADIIYVLNEGRIVEAGTFDSLMESKGLYFTMYTYQENRAK